MTFLVPFVGKASTTAVYTSSSLVTGLSTSSHNFTGADIGVPASGRRILAFVFVGFTGPSGTISVTLNGNAMTQLASTSSAGVFAQAYILEEGSSELAGIAVSATQTFATVGYVAYAIYGKTNSTPFDTATDNTAAISFSIDTDDGGCLAAAVLRIGLGAPTATWTNATEDLDLPGITGMTAASANDNTAQTGLNVSMALTGGSSVEVGAAVSFGP